ncbi:MAG TPA: GntR family transcriptional regulator [Steroidobacteraceae bacterium]|jgi:GntR family transcriptional regulator|nr:GntR family transcriptional regulator [Steroidobacteraceae bacterium]
MDKDLLSILPAAPEPIYQQIAAQLRRLIMSGRLAAGEELPSVREVAGHHAINPMTVSRAYSQLEAEGLLDRRRGKGMAVAESRRRPLSDERRLEELDAALEDLARQARELGLPAARVLERLRGLLER